MAKDPAFLFYSSDFLTGTMTMTDEQIGKYIRLLCLQHQKGILTEKDMLFICHLYDEDIWSKFIKTDDGFYNKRLRFESEKRALYSLSRASNRSKINKKKNKSHMKKICDSYVQHMENENENININENINNINNKIKEKIKYVDSVWLTDDEYKKLQEVMGQKILDDAISRLDYSITVKGGKYKDHYKTILNWNKRGFLKTNGGNANGNGNGRPSFIGRSEKTFVKTGGAQSDGEPWPADREY